ncbi:MAG: SIS domain-containing protein [Deltaproteobacteria bacterium]
MDLRNQIRGAPRALRETLKQASREFEETVRRTHWGDGPLFIVGSGPAYAAALTGSYAFEELLGWPVVTARAANFTPYITSVLRPRSVVLVIAGADEGGEMVEVVRQARTRGAAVLAMTTAATNPVAEAADSVFLIRTEEEQTGGLQAELCQQAAMGYLGVVAARVLKRRHQKLDELEREYQKLPDDADWVLRLSDAVKSLASALGNKPEVVLVGGGFYYPAALLAAGALSALGPFRARAVDAAELAESRAGSFAQQETIVFLSGSRGRFRKPMAELAQATKRSGCALYSLTDANDRALAEFSSMAFLLPMLNESPASILAFYFLQCTIAYVEHAILRPRQ